MDDPLALVVSLVGGGGAGAALVAAAVTWVPRLRRALREHRAAADASHVARAQADATLSEAWARLAGELRAERAALRDEHAAQLREREAERDRDREEWRRGLAAAQRAERECLDRYDTLSAALARARADDARRDALVRELAARLGLRTTPSRAHETVHSAEVAALDPLTTPPAGHPLTPPAAPAGARPAAESVTPPWERDDTPRG